MEQLGSIEKTYLGLVEAALFFLMMPCDKRVWEHFYQGKNKAGANRSHFEAYCHYCIGRHVRSMAEEDTTSMSRGIIEKTRSQEQLLVDSE
jgi:hypothetical protein